MQENVAQGEIHAILQEKSSKNYQSTEEKLNLPVPSFTSVSTVPETAVYHRRWYVLIVFLITGIMQGWMWNTFGPIAVALKHVGWPLDFVSATQIVLFSSTTFGAPVCAWIMDRKGLRPVMIFASVTLAVGCIIRCFTLQSTTFMVLNLVSFGVVGIGATVPLSAASALSSVWFPARERAFATAVCVESTNVGIAIAFLVGPAMVTTPTQIENTAGNVSNMHELDREVALSILREIMELMYIECGVAVGLLILVVCYYPNKPPKPPSISASYERVQFGKGLKEAFKSWKLWLLFLPYGTGCGIYYCWTSVYDVLLQPVGLSQTDAGWVAFYGTVVGITSAVTVSIFAGLFMRHLKKIVLIMLIITVGAVSLFIATTMGYMKFSLACLYVSALVSGAVLYAIVPLCFELACEVAYPISENIICLMLQWWNNVFDVLFFVLFLIPTTQRTWMNWVVLASTILSVISFAFLPEFYARLSIDEISQDDTETDLSDIRKEMMEPDNQTKESLIY